MKNYIFKKLANSSGFSLMEVILAIFIINVALVGIMSLVSYVTAATQVSAYKLTAANLAQEGIEIIKSMRDLDYLADYDGNGDPDYSWDGWYAAIVDGNYLVQYSDTALRGWQDIALKYDAATGLYGYDGAGSPSIYKRTITLQKISAEEVRVAVAISWTERGQTKSLMVEDRLWKWR